MTYDVLSAVRIDSFQPLIMKLTESFGDNHMQRCSNHLMGSETEDNLSGMIP